MATWYTVSLNRNGGSGGPATLYYSVSSGAIQRWSLSEGGAGISSITKPTRERYSFGGYKVTSAGANSGTWVGTNVVGRFGTITSTPISGKNMSATAQWSLVARKITFKTNGGEPGPSWVGYAYVSVNGGIYADDQCTTPLDHVGVPTKAGYTFTGFYYTTSGGAKYVNADGTWAVDYQTVTISRDITLYANWAVGGYSCTLDRALGMGGPDVFYLASSADAWCSDAELTQTITAITPPTRDGATFAGYYNDGTTPATQYVAADGSISLSAASAPREDVTLTAHWTLSAYIVDIDNDGGTGVERLYVDANSGGLFADSDCTLPVTSITPPTRTGYAFAGINDASTGAQMADSTGAFTFTPSAFAPGGDSYWIAQWTANTYTLTFDGNGGTPSAASKSVTYGDPIGTLPTCTRTGVRFSGWRVNGDPVTADTVWTVAGDGIAVAEWEGLWGSVKDHFGLSALANSPLVCVSSTDGATSTDTETSHTGALALQSANSTVGAYRGGGRILNPKCTYRITKSGNVTLIIGKAYGKATLGGSATEGGSTYRVVTESGFMLTGWKYATAADGEPTLTVTGTGNEGWRIRAGMPNGEPYLTDAINTWSVTLAVNPDHIAQDPLNAIAGGGELVECTTSGSCDPVVLYERSMPCASDVTHGMATVDATTCAYGGESAPTPRTGFVAGAVPTASEDVDFTTYTITAQRGLT